MCGCDDSARWTFDAMCSCMACHPDGPIAVDRPTLEEWVDAHEQLVAYSIKMFNTAERLSAESKRWKTMYTKLRARSATATGIGPGARTSDPITSHMAADEIKITAGKQRTRILYSYQYGYALLDREAAEMADVDPESCWWKRSSELRQGGFIQVVGIRVGRRKALAHTCQITSKGLAALGMLERTSDVS